MLGRAVNLYFITKYKNISTRKPKHCRAAMRIKEFILYGLRGRIVIGAILTPKKDLFCGHRFGPIFGVVSALFNLQCIKRL